MTTKWLVGIAIAAAAGGALAASACARREWWPGPRASVAQMRPPSSDAPPALSPPIDFARPLGPHPRILITPDRLATLRGLHAAGAPAWRALAAQCDEAARESIAAGYEAWDWANATLALALCHAATRRPEYARAALAYFSALLDDRFTVGDHAGGDEVVRHDDGYGIRTRGCFGAIAYDWLHDVPGMTPDVLAHAASRFVAWTKWFGEQGYNRDEPIANYYAGYFGAVAFAGIAIDGDDARSLLLRRDAARMYTSGIAPVYSRKLAGGDFPEGWQYGDMVGAILAMYSDAAGTPLPWLRDVVAYRTHALWPDGKHTFDSGDWGQKPAVAPAHTLLAIAATLPPSDAAERQARALAALANDPDEEWKWLAAIGADPSRTAEDPRRGATSHLARGTGTVLARTDWSPGAVWFALTSAPSLSDHQHLDAGHFEIVRGGDALVVDAGGYGSYSSLSHNVIAVDDAKENDTYAPNQATWSDAAHVERFEDAGGHAYALAEYTSAYNPAGYPQDHPRRSVTRAQREVVFSRARVAGLGDESARVVVYDRMTLTRASYRTTLLLHGSGAPEVQRDSARWIAGKSAAWATTLLPAGVPMALVPEPTNLGDGPYYANDPPEGVTSVRIEVRSPAGGVERRFLHAIVAGRADGRAPPVARVESDDADGAVVDDEAYVFVRDAPQVRAASLSWRAPTSVARHVVASLAPNARYDVAVDRDGDARCRVTLTPGTHVVASGAGVVVVDVATGCVVR